MAEYAWLGPVRHLVRGGFFKVLEQALRTEDGRRILADALKGLTPAGAPVRPLERQPYANLGRAPAESTQPPVFITGRFRSGSTLLWNIFRHVPACTSFYEPLNERRWFDPKTRGDRVDRTHVGVSDYWSEYDGLSHLSRWYREEWNDRQLYMDARSWDPGLLAYIQALAAAGRSRAVLQENRIDFRLPWLRRHFPWARFIHLYRHPRDQWCSTLIDAGSFPVDGTVAQFKRHDHFYLLAWARDLSYRFPFLDPRAAEHPYDLFYTIWKLSYLFGRAYCHDSFCFEALCEAPGRELPRLMQAAGVEDYDLDLLRGLLHPPEARKWTRYADHAWFAGREARCETVLAEYLTGFVPAAPLFDDAEARPDGGNSRAVSLVRAGGGIAAPPQELAS